MHASRLLIVKNNYVVVIQEENKNQTTFLPYFGKTLHLTRSLKELGIYFIRFIYI